MSLLAGWSLLGVALAGGLGDVDPAMPELRREPTTLYPFKDVYDEGVARRCTVRVVLGTKGRPASVEPAVCEEAIAARTVRRVRRARWDKDAPVGTTFDLEVVYTPPVDELLPVEAEHWRRVQRGACFAHVSVTMQGQPAVERHMEGCLPELAALGPSDPAWVRRHAPEICVVTFIVGDEGVRAADLFRCDLRLRDRVDELLHAWIFPVRIAGQPQPWTLLLELSGPADHRPPS